MPDVVEEQRKKIVKLEELHYEDTVEIIKLQTSLS